MGGVFTVERSRSAGTKKGKFSYAYEREYMMYTLVIVLTMLSGAGVKQLESIVVPGFATKIECINARILASQQFVLIHGVRTGVTIQSLCLGTPGSTT